jgi:hypothetical protein
VWPQSALPFVETDVVVPVRDDAEDTDLRSCL